MKTSKANVKMIEKSIENEALIMAQTPEERRRANIAAVKKAQEKTDAIMLRPSKEVGAAIRSAASAEGISTTQYILKAINFYENHKEEK